jgi:MoaD family protein
MKIKVYATLRQVVGDKRIDFPVDGSITFNEVLAELFQRYPGLKIELLDESGQLLERVHVLINGRDVRFLEDKLETKVDPEDIISIFPAVGGGSNNVDGSHSAAISPRADR